MDTEVVVVGGGIGGLTVAALLAARGFDVCLCEKNSSVGGCAASFEKFGYSFEQGYGLHALWEPDEIHHRVFAELPVACPEVHLIDPSYSVRLPDQTEVALVADTAQFEAGLETAFPECATQAVAFFRRLAQLNSSSRQLLKRTLDIVDAFRPRKTFPFLSVDKASSEVFQASGELTLKHLDGTSMRFRRFIDVQLQALGQASSAEVSHLYTALALGTARGGLFGLRGGAGELASRLADSIKVSGGRIRLDTTVLRLAYSSAGRAIGIDLLSGETIRASRAIISNLTMWDTYGKLVGLNRTPNTVRQQLKELRGWGSYLMYLAWDESAANVHSSDHLLALSNWQEDTDYDPEANQLFFCAAPAWDSRAPEGKRAVTVHAFTNVDDWFIFHTDESDLEARDQQMLEDCWQQLHRQMAELGSSVEVIDTATPRVFYEQTRRKMGMVGGVPAPLDYLRQTRPHYTTAEPNLFIVSDTIVPGGIAGLTLAAAALAQHLTK